MVQKFFIYKGKKLNKKLLACCELQIFFLDNTLFENCLTTH